MDPCEILTDFLYSFFSNGIPECFFFFFWLLVHYVFFCHNNMKFLSFFHIPSCRSRSKHSTHPAAAARDKQHFCVVVMLLVQIIDEKLRKGTSAFHDSASDRGTEKHSFLDCFDTYPPFGLMLSISFREFFVKFLGISPIIALIGLPQMNPRIMLVAPNGPRGTRSITCRVENASKDQRGCP